MTSVIMIIVLSFICVLLGLALFVSVKRNLELNDRFEELGTQVEESLDILNDCYQRIAQVSELPGATDDPIVVRLLADIRYVRHAVLLVANKVVTFDNDEDEQE